MATSGERAHRVAKQSVADSIINSLIASTGYTVKRYGSRLVVTDQDGKNVATMQFNDAPTDPSCVIWRGGHLVAQCSYSTSRKWSVYPIQHGKIAKDPLADGDPVRFLTEC